MKKIIILFVLLSVACGSAVPVSAVVRNDRGLDTGEEHGLDTGKEQDRPTRPPGADTRPPSAIYGTLCGNVNVRDNPSSAGRSYGNKLIGETVQVLGSRGEWVRIGPDRWIVNKLCK